MVTTAPHSTQRENRGNLWMNWRKRLTPRKTGAATGCKQKRRRWLDPTYRFRIIVRATRITLTADTPRARSPEWMGLLNVVIPSPSNTLSPRGATLIPDKILVLTERGDSGDCWSASDATRVLSSPAASRVKRRSFASEIGFATMVLVAGPSRQGHTQGFRQNDQLVASPRRRSADATNLTPQWPSMLQ